MVKKFILLSFCAFALAAQEIPFPANFAGWTRTNPKTIQADKEVKLSQNHSLRIEGNGTAIATVAAQGISAILCICYIFKSVRLIIPEKKPDSLCRAGQRAS